MIDLGTGNNNKMFVSTSSPCSCVALTIRNWAMTDKQEVIDIIETVYRGASKGRGLVVSPRGKSCCLFDTILTTDYSTRHKY